LVKSTISDERVKVEMVNGFDPLPISSYDDDTFGYQIIKKTVNDIFPQVAVTPGKAFSIVIIVIRGLSAPYRHH